MANNLKKYNHIRRLLAVVMLGLFAFSITPKIILHDVVANHKDTPYKSNYEKNAELNKAGFNCTCDNLVVDSPFTEDLRTDQGLSIGYFLQRLAGDANHFNAGHHFYSKLRGPPVEKAS